MPERKSRMSPEEEKALADHMKTKEEQVPDRETGSHQCIRRWEQKDASGNVTHVVEIYANEGRSDLLDKVDPETLAIDPSLSPEDRELISTQVIQIENLPNGGSIERAVKKEKQREYVRYKPKSNHELGIKWTEGREQMLMVSAVLEELGYSPEYDGVKGFSRPHGRFAITDPEQLGAFQGLVWEKEGLKKSGRGGWAFSKGDFGVQAIELDGRLINLEIGQINADFDNPGDEREVTKITLHELSWSFAKPKE